jgi:importin subunit alpha-6/7
MVDDLLTLCVVALRQHYQPPASVAGDENDRSGHPGIRRRRGRRRGRRSLPPLMMEGPVFEALSECATVIVDKPFLQIEAFRTLIVAFDTGLTPQQRENVNFGVLFELCESSDDAVSEKSGVLLGEISNNTSEELRHFFWEPLVRGALGNEKANQTVATVRFHHILQIPNNPPVQRVIESGLVPRFVESLRSDGDDRSTYPELLLAAVRALTCIICSGTDEHAELVIGAGAIRHFVRLLQSSTRDDVKESVALALACIANKGTEFRDDVLRNDAMPTLLILVDQASEGRKLLETKEYLYAIARLCYDDPPPPIALVRSALPTLARSLFSSDSDTIRNACMSFSFVACWPSAEIREVATPELGRRVVELLRHSCNVVQLYVFSHWRNPLFWKYLAELAVISPHYAFAVPKKNAETALPSLLSAISSTKESTS